MRAGPLPRRTLVPRSICDRPWSGGSRRRLVTTDDAGVLAVSPLGVPFLATVLEAAAGASRYGVQSWRTSGRRALNGLINLEALRSRTRRISSGDPKLDLTAIAQPIFDGLDNAEARCRNGADISVDFDALSERVDRLSTAAAIDGAFRKLPSAAQLILARLRAAMLGQSSDRGTASDAFRKTCQALTTNMIALPDLVEGTQHAQSSGMIVAKVLALPGDGPWREALRAARDSLNSVLADAIAPAARRDPPDDAAVAKRIAALAAARQSAESAAPSRGARARPKLLRSQAKATLQRQGASEEERSKAQSVLNHLEGVAQIVDLEERATRVADCWMELAKAGLEKDWRVLRAVRVSSRWRERVQLRCPPCPASTCRPIYGSRCLLGSLLRTSADQGR